MLANVLYKTINESKIFDEKWYLLKYPDVRQSGLVPLEHFIKYGIDEKRSPNRNFIVSGDDATTRRKHVYDYAHAINNKIISNEIQIDQNVEVHKLYLKAKLSGLFDYDWYLRTYPDIYLEPGVHPYLHYINVGWKENRDPSPNFDTKKYKTKYNNLLSGALSPLEHFITKGINNGLLYWPAKDYQYKPTKKIIFVENRNDQMTMHYRARLMGKQARKAGYNVHFAEISAVNFTILPHDFYAIYLVRTVPLAEHIKVLIERAHHFDVPIIYDIDDLLFDDTVYNQVRSLNYSDINRSKEYRGYKHRIDFYISHATAITTTTNTLRKELIRYGKPVAVIPNSIEKEMVKLSKKYLRKVKIKGINGQELYNPDTIIIGYFSGTLTHQDDFLECQDAMITILQRFPQVRLRVVGMTPFNIDNILNEHNINKDQLETLPLMHYEEMLSEISQCDIIIAPLETNNRFCDCKSELKLFEAAIFGIPCVCSPVYTYAGAISDGRNGFLAAGYEEWIAKLAALIDDSRLRERMGEAARLTLGKRFATENVFRIFSNFTLNIRQLSSNFSFRETGYYPPKPGKKNDSHDVTLIVTVYNKQDSLPAVMRSIQNNIFYGKLEVIFCDDSSTDDSRQIIENWIHYLDYSQYNSWLNCKYLTTSSNSGNCVSRNMGIVAAKADIVIIIDADCILSPNMIQDHYSHHVLLENTICLGCRGLETNGDDPEVVSSRYLYNPIRAIRETSHQDMYLHSSFVNSVTRNFSFNKKEFPLLFDENYSYTIKEDSGYGWEDVDFGSRLFTSGARFVFLRESFTLHCSHGSTVDNNSKPLRSLKNFRRLLSNNPVLDNLAPNWRNLTYAKIGEWLLRTDNMEQASEINELLATGLQSSITRMEKTKTRMLKILSYSWHYAHQYELCKLQHEFTYIFSQSDKVKWDWSVRPIPYNVKFIDQEKIDPSAYDIAICHFDENVLKPELANGVLHGDWGDKFKFISSLRDKLPVIYLCHGTPQFRGQFSSAPSGVQVDVIEENREQLRQFIGDSLVVLNSWQACKEWGFINSEVIWHGFQPSEFRPLAKNHTWSVMSIAKMKLRPHYNGFDLFRECMTEAPIAGTIWQNIMDVGSLPLHKDADLLLWSEIMFARYRELIASSWFYLNFTQRSPMPRMRGEAMMSGVIPITTANHDADMFIIPGKNGFIFSDAVEFKEIIAWLQAHEDSWRNMANAARQTAVRYFHIDGYLQKWRNILRKYC